MKILYEGGSSELTEKKSRFIGAAFPVDTAEQAEELIAQVKKRYWDAAHNCYAYCTGGGSVQRFSDDGEPSQTAGKPILDVLLNEGVCDALIIVTRYFGGTLLGTGGLVRAYGAAAKAALESSVIIEKRHGYVVRITMDYTSLGKIEYAFRQLDITIIKTDYQADVTIEAVIADETMSAAKKEVQAVTAGTSEVEKVEECEFGYRQDGEIVIL